jgi:hypothetical protein
MTIFAGASGDRGGRVQAASDIAVKRTAVRLLWDACEGILDEDAPLSAALTAALQSPNDRLFVFNYKLAEQEFGRLPRAKTEALMSRCQSRIAENQTDILSEIRGMTATKPAAPKAPAKPAAKAPAAPKTAREWS